MDRKSPPIQGYCGARLDGQTGFHCANQKWRRGVNHRPKLYETYDVPLGIPVQGHILLFHRQV